ncbi:hypothetical protein [Nocardia sp. NPDC059195]|uniref:hypothetical protein n=1 Tax=Nocardia sp. NPDC059195 TaxID=3346765 RepID=UPI0036BBFA9E
MTSPSMNTRCDAATVGTAVVAASRAAAGGRQASVGIWVIWLRGRRVMSCESVARLDQDVPASRWHGVDGAVVVAVVPSRLASPVLGRARVIVDYLDGQGLDVRAVHARALHDGSMWTVLRGPAFGGVIASTAPVPRPQSRRHRWLPGFGPSANQRLAIAALAPLAAAVLAAPAAYAGPAGQPGVISDPRPGQPGVSAPGPAVPNTPGPVGPNRIHPGDLGDTPEPSQNTAPAPTSPEPAVIVEPQPAPMPQAVAEPPLVVVPQGAPSQPVVTEPQMFVEPATPPVNVSAPQPPTGYDVTENSVVEPQPIASAQPAYGDGAGLPQPQWQTPEATADVDGGDQGGLTDLNVEAVLDVAADTVALPEAVEGVVSEPLVQEAVAVVSEPLIQEVEAASEPIVYDIAAVSEPFVEDVVAVASDPLVQEVAAVLSEQVTDVVAAVDPQAAQVLGEVLAQWPPALG